MKKQIRIWLSEEAIKRLRAKAEALGFEKRASLTRYIEKVSMEDIIFLSSDVRAVIKLFTQNGKTQNKA